jgi:hypothetical protein
LSILRRVSDPRLRKLGQRLVFIERPDLLTPEDRQRYTDAVVKRLRPHPATEAPWRTLDAVERWFSEQNSEISALETTFARTFKLSA